ncbi:MAG: BsuPI-related putative proteinase inhibitor [bacterium]
MPFPAHTLRAATAAAVLLSFVAACTSDSNTSPTQSDAARAVIMFRQLADSVSRSGGDAQLGGAYASLAEVVRMGGRISPVIITVDGVATPFSATALYTEVNTTPPCAVQVCSTIKQVSILRTLIAWQDNDPRRVVELSSEADTNAIHAYVLPVTVAYPGTSAALAFFDGKGGMFFGTSGTQTFGVTTSELPCTSAAPAPFTPAIFPAPPLCTQANFSVAFNATAEPSRFLASKNNATGTHTFSMSAQPVLGARFQLSAIVPPLPPIIVTPSAALPATISVKVDSVVTLTLTVTNPSSSPVTVNFNSGKHYDFIIMDATNRALIWRWGMGMMFTQALSSETIPGNGKLEYTTQWKPANSGQYIAVGSLVSFSHLAEAKAPFTVP